SRFRPSLPWRARGRHFDRRGRTSRTLASVFRGEKATWGDHVGAARGARAAAERQGGEPPRSGPPDRKTRGSDVPFSLDPEVVVEDGRVSVRVDRDVEGLVDEKVVPRSWPDHAEVVDTRERNLAVLQAGLEMALRHSRAVIDVAGIRAHQGCALRLGVILHR